MLIPKELFALNTLYFDAFSRLPWRRFVDSKRVNWRILGETSQLFYLIIFRSSRASKNAAGSLWTIHFSLRRSWNEYAPKARNDRQTWLESLRSVLSGLRGNYGSGVLTGGLGPQEAPTRRACSPAKSKCSGSAAESLMPVPASRLVGIYFAARGDAPCPGVDPASTGSAFSSRAPLLSIRMISFTSDLSVVVAKFMRP